MRSPSRCHAALAAAIVASGGAPACSSAGPSAERPSSVARGAAYPPVFRYYGGAALAARASAIARDVGVPVRDLELDPLGCVREIVFRDAGRVALDPARPTSLSEAEATSWSRFFTGLRDPFCIPQDASIRFDRVPPGVLEAPGAGERRRIYLNKEAEGGGGATPAHFVRARVDMWSPPELPAARVDVASAVRDLVGRPFTLHARARDALPYCQGCPHGPNLDLGTIESAAAVEDFTASPVRVELVCGPGSTLELRRVLHVSFAPRVEAVSRRARKRLDLRQAERSAYRLEGSVVGHDAAISIRMVDAVTGERLRPPGWRFLEDPASEAMCDGDGGSDQGMK